MSLSVHRNVGRLIVLILYNKVYCPKAIWQDAEGRYHLNYYEVSRRHKKRVGRVRDDIDYLMESGFIYDHEVISQGWCRFRFRNQEELAEVVHGQAD